MPLPDYPVAIQVNWSKTAVWSPWNQANANILCQYSGKPTLVDLALRRGVFYPTFGADTATIKSLDPGWHLVPDKNDSALFPSPLTGCPLRVLQQTAPGAGDWRARFFGYITSVQPDAVDAPASQSTVTITAESPLRYLGAQNVTPRALLSGEPIYSTTADSALRALLEAAGLWVPELLNIEDPGTGGAVLPDNWGGDAVQFGQALIDLAYLAGAAIRATPLYAVASGDPDWRFTWWTPAFGAPSASLSAPAGALSTGASAQWKDLAVA